MNFFVPAINAQQQLHHLPMVIAEEQVIARELLAQRHATIHRDARLLEMGAYQQVMEVAADNNRGVHQPQLLHLRVLQTRLFAQEPKFVFVKAMEPLANAELVQMAQLVNLVLIAQQHATILVTT